MIVELDFEAEALVADFEGLRVSFGKFNIAYHRKIVI